MRVRFAGQTIILAGVAIVTPIAAHAQGLPVSEGKQVVADNEIGGKVSFESMRTSIERPSLPLRFGQVMHGSETVVMDGRTLVRDKDYYIDYTAGVVYLKTAYRDNQSVQVQYRYDEAKGTAGTFGLGSKGTKFQGFTFQMAKGTSMVLGMGLTERLGDGTVLSSNVYGLRNSFKLGSGQLQGLYMVGDRKKVTTNNLFGETGKGQEVEEGRSQAIVQRLASGFLGGQIKLNYQDIGDKFGGFSSFDGSGFSESEVQQFSKERGLKRSGFAADGIGGKSLNLKAGTTTVGDDAGSVSWRNYGATLAGVTVAWNAFKVDPGFSRFRDLAEGDRDQLAKERGLERQSFSAKKDWTGGGLKYDSTKLETLDGAGFYRRAFNFALPVLSASFSDQHVQQGFNRFGDMREADRDQLSRETGLVRENKSIALTPKHGPQVSWSDSAVRTDNGDLKAVDFGLKSGSFSLEHSRLDVGAGFDRLGSLPGDEINRRLTSIVKMLDPAAAPQGADGGGWGAANGLNRSVWRMMFGLGKSASFGASANVIDGAKDDLSVRTFDLKSSRLTANYRVQDTGKEFTESNRLLLTEQQRLGTAPGVQKSDFNLGLDLGKARSLNYQSSSAQDAAGGFARQVLAYAAKGMNVNYTRRSVDSAFASLGGIVDPERDRLMAMMGFDQAELTGAWQLNSKLGITYHDSSMLNAKDGLGRFESEARMLWNLGKNTQFALATRTQKQTDPTAPLVDQQTDVLALTHNFGKVGKVSYSQERSTFDGKNDTNPDLNKQTVVYENQITKTTSVRTEQSLTRYENGEHETTTSNSLSQALSPRVGVSVTDTKVEREGDKPDETHRDYGFWVDFGRNIRFNYKAARQLKGTEEGELHNDVSVTPGQVQGINIGSASYQRNGWDDRRDQHIGNVSLSNVKPMKWGFLRDVRFNYSVDSLRDNEAWQKEYRTMGFGARIGAFAFGVDYKSQALPTGDRAIDRIFSFTTDTTGKSWIKADIKYNLRTLPMGQQAMVRNYTVAVRPAKHWTVTHALDTNPLQADGNALLGAIATPTRSNKWGVAFDGNPRTKFGMGYEEFYNEQNNQQVTSLKLGATLFANNPSPLNIEYVMAESNASGSMQRSHGFNFSYNQRPGPNQSLSFKLSNLNWELARPADQNLQNWNLRLDYSWKF